MEPRLTAPAKDNPYYTTYSPFYIAGVGMPNCTAYSWGRIAELKQVTSYQDALDKVHLCRMNARQWWDYTQDGYSRGDRPVPGAVAVFEGIATNAAGKHYGHVMIVEKVEDDTVTLSGSDADVDGSGGRYFYVDEMAMDELRDPSYHGGLLGFIYAYQEAEVQEVTPKMSELDAKKLVICDYAQYLGRMPSQMDIDADTRNIVDTGMTTEQYDYSFIVSEEYKDKYGYLATQDFVTRCYRAFLGRFPESEETMNGWVEQIVNGSKRYRDIAWDIYSSEEAKAYRGEE